tara:strand:- start:1181 stop:2542 length:1362 start_codon:yes stop_codon:yes gene_type:complete
MEKLNNKIQRTRAEKLDSVQATGLYAYNQSDDTYNRAEVSDNGDLHVNIHGTTGGGDMKARTNINDSSTSTFLKCNADGTLEMTAELSSAGLATEAKQDTINTSITDGSAKVQILGNTEADGSGTSEHLHTDGNGNLNVQVISTVNTLPANSLNSGITDDPANTVAVGLRGRQTITDASTETFLKCDANGVLEVSSSGGGGDATAANQVTINNSIGDTNSKIDAMRASDSLTTVKAEITSLRTETTDGSAKAKCMGADSLNAQYQLRTDTDGHLQIDIVGNSDTTKATSTLQTAGNTSLVNIDNNISSVQSTVASNRLKVSPNNADHGTLAQLSVGTGSTGALSAILDTAGYSKVVLIAKNSTNTSTSITASALWSDSATFSGGTDLVMNSDDTSGGAFAPTTFQTATSADSSTFLGSQCLFSITPPAQYMRINIFQSTGSTLDIDFFYILSN